MKRKHWNPADTANKRCTDLFKQQMDAAQAKLDAQNPDNDSKPSRGAVAERKLAAAVAADTDAARLEVRISTEFDSTVQGLIDSWVDMYRS